MFGHGTLSHGALGDWALDPFAIVGAALALSVYVNGLRPASSGRRAIAFAVGLVAALAAVVSPVHVAAEESLSWHMLQHVLLVGVAAPLIAASAPGATLLRGLGRRGVEGLSSVRRTLGGRPDRIRQLRNPLGRWLAFVLVFWGWHTARLYSLAIEHDWVHSVEHLSFIVAAFAVWSSVLGPARTSGRSDPAIRVLVVFLLGLQGVILSALMTFSREPWYPAYVDSLGNDALADQHLAGVLMWVPLGILYASAGVWATVTWLGSDDEAGS